MKYAMLIPLLFAAMTISGCATDSYDGCHGVGCTVDKPDSK